MTCSSKYVQGQHNFKLQSTFDNTDSNISNFGNSKSKSKPNDGGYIAFCPVVQKVHNSTLGLADCSTTTKKKK